MADPARAARLAQRIKVVVAEALRRRVKDPRIEAVTITDARVTNDLQHATLYYTVLGDAEQVAETRRALESARGVLRKEVGRNITVRLTPTLEFVPDEIPVNAGHLEELLRAAKDRDAEVAALAQGASFAGDPDPYRTDAEDEPTDQDSAADEPADDKAADQDSADQDSADSDSADQDSADPDSALGVRSDGTPSEAR